MTTTFLRMSLIIFIMAAAVFSGDITYCVSGVQQNDSLNMRKEARAQSIIVQKIPFNARGISIVADANNSETWCKIRYNTSTGWVNRKFLAAESAVSQKESFECLGTEPFWKVSIQNGQLLLNNPPDEKRVYTIKKFQQSLNNENQWFVEAESTDGKKIEAFLLESACSDDMSDTKYTYRLMLYDSAKDQTINGCCNKK